MNYFRIGLQNVSSPSSSSSDELESTESINYSIISPVNWSSLTALQTKFEVKYHPYKFIAYVRREEGLYKVLMGKEKECVRISVYDDDDDSDAYINSFTLDEKCGEVMTDEEIRTLNRVKSLNSKKFVKYIASQVNSQINTGLLPGVGSVALFKAACMVVFRLFPKVNSISFKDTSKIYSKIKKNIDVSLPILYIVKYGQTWYEKKFGAIPENHEYERKLNQEIKQLLSEKLSEDFDIFYKLNIESVGRKFEDQHIKKLFDYKKIFKQKYLISETITDFVNNILKDYDCLLLAEWLENYVNDRIEWKPNKDWLINREIVITWPQRTWNLEIIETKDTIDQNPFATSND